VSGAFGPMEVEKLTMYNIDRDRAICEDAMMGAIGPHGQMLPLPAPVELRTQGRRKSRLVPSGAGRSSFSGGDDQLLLIANHSTSSAGMSSLKQA
jgi:hypothetical protein